jgi:anhydro-N-acetylmuramic acid kinase
MIVIGLISGTSVDGIDAAVVEITGENMDLTVNLLAGKTYPYPPLLRKKILEVCEGKPLSMAELSQLDDAIATEFALGALKIQENTPKAQLIGSHGQTVFHRPPHSSNLGYSLQLGRGELIAHLTKTTTVSNFRSADLALGGHGAPLVPKIDACLFSHPTLSRCIQNLGGIGNVAYLPPRNSENWENQIIGWDTGPGNVLIDLAITELTQGKQTFDPEGQWAAQGTPCESIIEEWLQQDFFLQPPPKSTGRELFSLEYLKQSWQSAQSYKLNSADWLATLTEFTVTSIVHSYEKFLPQMPQQILLCGGGSRNNYLKKRLQQKVKPIEVLTTLELGISTDDKEAIAFAILAYWRSVCNFPGNLPSVTGALKYQLLGDIHLSP